jgi:hypothetical protein
MPVDGNAGAERHLLSSEGKIVGACGGPRLDKDVAVVAKVNQVLALRGAEHISLTCHGLAPPDTWGQGSADAEAPESQ